MTSRLRGLREWMQRLLGTLRGGRPDEDLEEELRAHAALAAEARTREQRSIDSRSRPCGISAASRGSTR